MIGFVGVRFHEKNLLFVCWMTLQIGEEVIQAKTILNSAYRENQALTIAKGLLC